MENPIKFNLDNYSRQNSIQLLYAILNAINFFIFIICSLITPIVIISLVIADDLDSIFLLFLLAPVVGFLIFLLNQLVLQVVMGLFMDVNKINLSLNSSQGKTTVILSNTPKIDQGAKKNLEINSNKKTISNTTNNHLPKSDNLFISLVGNEIEITRDLKYKNLIIPKGTKGIVKDNFNNDFYVVVFSINDENIEQIVHKLDVQKI